MQEVLASPTQRGGIVAVNTAEIAIDDHLIIEARLSKGIWDRLTVQCARACGTRCVLVCPSPCRLAKRIISRFLPRYFESYARWN